MSELDEKTIMVELGFVNEMVEVSGDCGCIFIKELLDCCNSHNNKFKIFKHSKLFKKFILNNFEKKDLRKYSIEEFEELFLEFGYYGYEKGIRKLRRLYKKIILERFRNTKSVRKLFKENFKKVSDPNLCTNPNITGKFIDEMGISSLLEISISTTLPFSYIKKYLDVLLADRFYSDNLANNKSLKEDFFGTFKKYVDWSILSSREDFSEKFFEKYIKRCNLIRLIQNPVISEAFIRKHEVYINNKVGSQMIWMNPNLSQTFVNERIEQIYWDFVAKHNRVLDEKFYMKHEGDFEGEDFIPVLLNMASNDTISLDYVMTHANITFIKNRFFNKFALSEDRFFWEQILKRDKLTVKFLETHLNEISQTDITYNSNIPTEFFLKYPQFQNVNFLLFNSSATSEMLYSYVEKMGNATVWSRISSSPLCDEEFIKKYKDNIDWSMLCFNKFRAEKQVDFSKDPLVKYL